MIRNLAAIAVVLTVAGCGKAQVAPTDKAAVEVPTSKAGVVETIHVKIGEKVPISGTLLTLKSIDGVDRNKFMKWFKYGRTFCQFMKAVNLGTIRCDNSHGKILLNPRFHANVLNQIFS